MLAIAEAAGDPWPAITREAALALSGETAPANSVGAELLRDIRDHFESTRIDRISSEGLVSALCADETRRWSTHNKGQAISQRQVAKLLAEFGIAPGTIRLPDGKTPRGYLRERCEDAFARYLPALEVQHRHNPSQMRVSGDFVSATAENLLRIEKPLQAASSKACGVVADKNRLSGGEERF